MTLNFQDFQIQDIKFDINELQKAYKQIVKIKNFDGPEGITNFGAISLTQIPGDPDSVKGNKARGVYWTKPDKSGKEVTAVSYKTCKVVSSIIPIFSTCFVKSALLSCGRVYFLIFWLQQIF